MFHSVNKCWTFKKYILPWFKLTGFIHQLNGPHSRIHSDNYVNKRCIFFKGRLCEGCRQCESLSQTVYWEWAPECDLLSLHNTFRQQACRLCSASPRYPYTKPHAQQLVLPEEFKQQLVKVRRSICSKAFLFHSWCSAHTSFSFLGLMWFNEDLLFKQ